MAINRVEVLLTAKDRASREIDKSTKSMKGMEGAAKSVTKAYLAVAASVAIAAYGAVALTKKVVALGREFEFNMKTVEAWTGASGKAMEELTDIAREMGATTEHTATEAAGALKFLASAGFTAKQSIAALPGTLDLATAGQVNLSAATDIVTDTLTAFGLSVKELNRVSDAFIITASSSNTNVLMLGGSFKMVAATAKLFGISIEETAAMLGALADSGIKAEMAGAGLNMVLLKSRIAAKMLGMDAMTPLVDVLKKMREEQWNATKIGAAFGVRQVKTAGILMASIDKFEKLTQKIKDNQGATTKLARIMRDTLDVDLKTLNSTVEDQLLRTFDLYKEEIREVIKATTEWIRNNEHTIDVMTKLIHDVAYLTTLLARGAGFVAEYAGAWVSVWKAMGLASVGLIGLDDALFRGTDALEKFNEELGPQKLRLAWLERIIATKKFTNKVWQEAKMLRKIIANRQAFLDELEAMEGRSKEIDRKAEAARKAAIDALPDAIPAPDPKIQKAWEKAKEDHIALVSELFELTVKMTKDREQLEKETLENFRQAKMTETELALDALDKEFLDYVGFVKDKDALDKWYMEQHKEIMEAAEDENEDMIDSMESAMQGWANSFSGTLNDMLWGAEFTFKNIAESFARMITQMVIQKQIIEPMFGGGGSGSWISTVLGALAGLTGPPASAVSAQSAMPIMLTAKGGVFSGISAYSNQIISKPTLLASGSVVIGEAGSEAVMPLTRMSGGDLGVKTEGGGGTQIIIIANDAKSFADMVNRNPESIISVIGEALEGRTGLLDKIRETI